MKFYEFERTNLITPLLFESTAVSLIELLLSWCEVWLHEMRVERTSTAACVTPKASWQHSGI